MFLRRTVVLAALVTAVAACSKGRTQEASATTSDAEPSGPGPIGIPDVAIEPPVALPPAPEPREIRPIEPPSGLPGEESRRAEPVTFTTPDGVEIHASFWRAGDPEAPTAVFIHQARSDRSEWEPFVRELRETAPGIAVLTIDLRGHGESLRAGERTLRADRLRGGSSTGLEKWSGCTTDVQTAVAYLRGRGEGTIPRAIGLVGSSIGSTSVIRAVASDGVEGPGRIAAVVAISPGMSYFSVPIQPALETLKVRSFPLMVIAARDDSNDPVRAIERMQELVGELVEIHLYEEGGHGVAIARAHGDVVPLVIGYLKAKLEG